MINSEIRKAYYEVLVILKYLPACYTKMIPKHVISIFESQKEEYKELIVDINKPINKEFLSKQAIEIIAMLNYEYWCKDEDKKQKLHDMYRLNEIKHQEELKEKYDIYKTFDERKNKSIEYDNSKSVSLIEYKESFFKKIINKIKILIYKKKG